MLTCDVVGHGPAILFVHGFPLDRWMWHPQVAALEGYRRIAPDLPGLGESPAAEGPATMASYAAELGRCLDHLGVESVVLCGLSMGGYVAFECLGCGRRDFLFGKLARQVAHRNQFFR